MKCNRRTLNSIVNGQIRYPSLKNLNEILRRLGMKLYVDGKCILPIAGTNKIAIPLSQLTSKKQKKLTHFELSSLAEISEQTEKRIRNNGITTLYQLISICVAIQATVECK